MLVEKQAQFAAMLDEDDVPCDRAVRLFKMVSANTARVSRLLGYRRAMAGGAGDENENEIEAALLRQFEDMARE